MIDMEWKIGEIRQIDGEWYQCVESHFGCEECDFKNTSRCSHEGMGCSYPVRQDHTSVIFKKLEKVGEPYTLENKKFQKYRVLHTPYIYNKVDCSLQSFADPYYISLEIKQTKKEVMYIHKVAMNIDDRDYLLDKLESVLHDTHCQQYKDEICEAFSKYITTESVPDLKSFDLNAAKAGKPVYTRDGRKARIICFDANGEYPLIALITLDNDAEDIKRYTVGGRYYGNSESNYDLMMLPEKKEGWVNLYDDMPIYDTKEEALNRRSEIRNLIDAIKVSWSE